jgi:phage terminase Nu1 subunit (DNA packaging protein)
MPPRKTKAVNTTAQKKLCAARCGLTLATVSKYVSEYQFDASDPERFYIQWQAVKKDDTPKDIDEAEAKKKLAIEKAHKMEIDRKRAELELSIKKGATIPIAEEAQLWAHVGLVIKSTLESLPRTSSIMLEGKTAKEIEKVLDGKVREILLQLTNIKK